MGKQTKHKTITSLGRTTLKEAGGHTTIVADPADKDTLSRESFMGWGSVDLLTTGLDFMGREKDLNMGKALTLAQSILRDGLKTWQSPLVYFVSKEGIDEVIDFPATSAMDADVPRFDCPDGVRVLSGMHRAKAVAIVNTAWDLEIKALQEQVKVMGRQLREVEGDLARQGIGEEAECAEVRIRILQAEQNKARNWVGMFFNSDCFDMDSPVAQSLYVDLMKDMTPDQTPEGLQGRFQMASWAGDDGGRVLDNPKERKLWQIPHLRYALTNICCFNVFKPIFLTTQLTSDAATPMASAVFCLVEMSSRHLRELFTGATNMDVAHDLLTEDVEQALNNSYRTHLSPLFCRLVSPYHPTYKLAYNAYLTDAKLILARACIAQPNHRLFEHLRHNFDRRWQDFEDLPIDLPFFSTSFYHDLWGVLGPLAPGMTVLAEHSDALWWTLGNSTRSLGRIVKTKVQHRQGDYPDASFAVLAQLGLRSQSSLTGPQVVAHLIRLVFDHLPRLSYNLFHMCFKSSFGLDGPLLHRKPKSDDVYVKHLHTLSKSLGGFSTNWGEGLTQDQVNAVFDGITRGKARKTKKCIDVITLQNKGLRLRDKWLLISSRSALLRLPLPNHKHIKDVFTDRTRNKEVAHQLHYTFVERPRIVTEAFGELLQNEEMGLKDALGFLEFVTSHPGPFWCLGYAEHEVDPVMLDPSPGVEGAVREYCQTWDAQEETWGTDPTSCTPSVNGTPAHEADPLPVAIAMRTKKRGSKKRHIVSYSDSQGDAEPVYPAKRARVGSDEDDGEDVQDTPAPHARDEENSQSSERDGDLNTWERAGRVILQTQEPMGGGGPRFRTNVAYNTLWDTEISSLNMGVQNWAAGRMHTDDLCTLTSATAVICVRSLMRIGYTWVVDNINTVDVARLLYTAKNDAPPSGTMTFCVPPGVFTDEEALRTARYLLRRQGETFHIQPQDIGIYPLVDDPRWYYQVAAALTLAILTLYGYSLGRYQLKAQDVETQCMEYLQTPLEWIFRELEPLETRWAWMNTITPFVTQQGEATPEQNPDAEGANGREDMGDGVGNDEQDAEGEPE
ncbi:hypothetical protein FRB99_006531, partial [Tulasnella sp. 403]